MDAVMEGRCAMRKVKVKRDELLKKVRQNRVKHIEEYAQAVIGYKKKAIQAVEDATKRLTQRIGELKEGEVIKLSAITFDLRVPQNHSRDYDQVIAMLEMSVDPELEIQTDEFAMYVMDNWDWKEAFVHTANLYKA